MTSNKIYLENMHQIAPNEFENSIFFRLLRGLHPHPSPSIPLRNPFPCPRHFLFYSIVPPPPPTFKKGLKPPIEPSSIMCYTNYGEWILRLIILVMRQSCTK